MKCAYCGTTLRRESMFCLGCGKPVIAKDCYIKELEQSGGSLTKATDKSSLNRIIGMTAKIYDYTKDDEEVRLQTRDLFEDYLPDITKIVSRYKRLKGRADSGEKLEVVKSELTEVLNKTERAFEIVLEEITEKDINQLRIDIMALKNEIARDGLTDSDFNIEKK